jgi:hypothetical protein
MYMCFRGIDLSSDWTNIYFASILADSAFSSICTLISSCPLIPGSNTPVCVSGSCRLVISLSLYLIHPYIPDLLFVTFVVGRIPASLSIVTGVAVSFNVKLAQLRPFYLKCLFQARKPSGHVYVC